MRAFPWATSSADARRSPENAGAWPPGGPLDPRAGVVDAGMMVAFEGRGGGRPGAGG